MKSRSRSESESEQGASVGRCSPETKCPPHAQVEGVVKHTGGPNPCMLKNAGMSCG